MTWRSNLGTGHVFVIAIPDLTRKALIGWGQSKIAAQFLI
jgi:hypothetical protein